MAQLTLTHQSPRSSQLIHRLLKAHFSPDEVHLNPLDWGELWTMLRTAIAQRHGSEIAEIGTTWLGSLVTMNGLRPFEDSDITRLGGYDSFMPVAWKHCYMAGDSRAWALPFTLDSRCVFYWHDMLEDAAIDPETAFTTPEAVEATLQRLQDAGIRAPWAAPMTTSNLTLQHLASWVWHRGGEFLSDDGKRLLLLQPEALRGMAEFFRLNRFTAPDELPDDAGAIDRFLNRQAAAIMGGTWVLNQLPESARETLPAEMRTALPPGPSFVGGTALVIMNHLDPQQERLALNVTKYLSLPDFQAEFCHWNVHLPARMDALNSRFFADTPLYPMFVRALETGCVLPGVPQWSIIEERLKDAFAAIWNDLHTGSNVPVESVILRHLEPAVKRLEMTLAL
jgi:multiple sugar transport system substrate-binding protein